MKKDKRPPVSLSDLRRRAEDQLREKSGQPEAVTAAVEAQRLVHELQVHQVELEMQNEELERARTELEAGLARYTDLYDFAPVGYFTLGHDGTIRTVNLSGARLLKLDRSGAVGQSFQRFVAQESRSAFDAFLKQVFESDGKKVCDIALRPQEDATIWVHTEAAGLAGGQECRAVLVDITERKQAQAALLEANARLVESDRHKNQFLAVLSHELRNPLTPVKNSLYILDRATPGGDQAQRAKDVIQRQVDQLAHLIDDLLDVTRVASGKVQLQCRRLELNQLVKRTIEDQRTLFERAGLTIAFEPAAQDVFVNADWNRVAQIVSNLLQNAIKFTPRGKVTIAVSADKILGISVVRVSDTGIGMTREMLGHLFRPFMQADTTLERGKGGLGLGLALTKGLVEQHGGTIEGRSEGLGRGSEFIVRLPLDLTGHFEQAPSRAKTAKVRRRVLIIEDNIDAADSLREVLQLEGHEVAVAYLGSDGIAKARTFHPDLVLCDIGLPGMDGYDVARAFRGDPELKHMGLVALSGYALPEDLHRAADAGFDNHLAKPPSFDKLEDILAAPRPGPGARGNAHPSR